MRRLALAAGVLLLAGCGGSTSSTSAADEVPGLGVRLERVDTFVAAGEWGKARTALRRIVTDAEAARTAGDLDAAAADRVVASAQRLLAALPASPAPTPTATPTPTRTTPTGTQSSRDDHKGKGGDDKGGAKKHGGKKH